MVNKILIERGKKLGFNEESMKLVKDEKKFKSQIEAAEKFLKTGTKVTAKLNSDGICLRDLSGFNAPLVSGEVIDVRLSGIRVGNVTFTIDFDKDQDYQGGPTQAIGSVPSINL